MTLMHSKIDKRGIHPSDWKTAWQSTGQEDLYFCAVAAELYGDGERGYELFSALLENHPEHYWGLLGLEGSLGFYAPPKEHISHLLSAKRLRPDLLSS